MSKYHIKREQQQINYKITMLSDTKERLKRELESIDTSISLLHKKRLELHTEGLNKELVV